MENQVHIEEVGVRRPRLEQVAASREVCIGVVVVERSMRARSAAFERPAVDDRAGGIRRSVGAVGAGGENDDVVAWAQLECSGERELLTSTAKSKPPNGHRGLASGDQAGRRWQRPRTGDEVAGDDPGL